MSTDGEKLGQVRGWRRAKRRRDERVRKDSKKRRRRERSRTETGLMA